LAVVRDLREARAPAGPDELAALETDVLAGFVLARAAAGMADSTIAGDVVNLEQIRVWFGGAVAENVIRAGESVGGRYGSRHGGHGRIGRSRPCGRRSPRHDGRLCCYDWLT
jgi:hypothetical protein